jgi:hypothetical protein
MNCKYQLIWGYTQRGIVIVDARLKYEKLFERIGCKMDSAFYELFGQIGATIVSIAFTLFVAYLLYVKEQRDKIGNQITALKRNMFVIFTQLLELPIPGVAQSLTSPRPRDDEKKDRLSITEWAAGTTWEMRVSVEGINRNEIWNKARKGIENLVKGVLPNGSFPTIEIDSDSFRKWGKDFVDDTEHIRWFTHEYGGHSWARSFLEKMREWEIEYPNPVLRSEDIASMLEKIMVLRRLVNEDLLQEENYRNLKIENAINHYKIIISAFMAMSFFSIFVPLAILLFPPVNNEYLIQVGRNFFAINVLFIGLSSFLGFLFASLLIIWLLIKAAQK